MEVTKTDVLLMAIIGMLIVAITSIGVAKYNQTGCFTGCSVASGVELNPYLDETYHEIPEPSTLLLVSAGVGVLIKMRG